MTSNHLTDTAIRVRGLRRRYGSGATAFEAVRGVDLDVRTGSITALLGTNGAGKTSTLEVIEGLAPASDGEVSVLGLDPVRDRAEVRRRTGVLLQKSGFSGDLTVRETLRLWHGTITDPQPVGDLLEALSLGHRADVRVSALSGGETRRLDLACTLMGRPELVFLDEPTTGLDPESRREVWNLVRRLRDGGATVLVTTHYLAEAESLADRLEIMHAGQIVRSGTPTEIAEGHPSTITFTSLDAAGAQLPGDLAAVRGAVEEQGRTRLETTDLQGSLTALLTWAERAGVRLEGLEARTASLESVFLAIADGRDAATDDTPASDAPADPAGTLEGATR